MKLQTPLPITELAAMIGAELVGSTEVIITHLKEIHKETKRSLIFFDNDNYFSQEI